MQTYLKPFTTHSPQFYCTDCGKKMSLCDCNATFIHSSFVKARKILDIMSSLPNIYGFGARIYKNDPELGTAFLLECYEQIHLSPVKASEIFGAKNSEDIREYFMDPARLIKAKSINTAILLKEMHKS